MAPEATIAPLDRDHRMYVGEARPFYVEVTNGGAEAWPGGLEQEPRVRLSYHLRSGDGELLQADGPRSPLPAPLRPGESQIAPVVVEAPSSTGSYLVEIDLVEEHLRWFGEPARVSFEVVPRGPTERNVPRRRGLPRRTRIPRLLHQVWVGSAPMPDECRRYIEGWKRFHPRWEHRLWTDDDLPALGIGPELVRKAVTGAELANLVRYHVVAKYGGVYVDVDTECLRPIDDLVRGVDGFAGCSFPGNFAPGLFGAVPSHPAIVRCRDFSRQIAGTRYPETTSGPILFTTVLWDFPNFTIYPPSFFYPYLWHEPDRRHDHFGRAYAVHHWLMSWRQETSAEHAENH
jgi:inositol phosphorylceramide mannosyltransferase catalytic subunit